jgi:hypothetical protein
LPYFSFRQHQLRVDVKRCSSSDKAVNYRVASIFGCAERAEKTALFDRADGNGPAEQTELYVRE